VVGTSVGAINGAAIATSPTVAMANRLASTWLDIERSDVFAGSLFNRLATLARTGTHLHDNVALRAVLTEALEIPLIEDLPVRFECVAASIEAAAEHWFTSGSLVDAVLASAAVPGLLPPVEIGGEHFIDGGIVNSIPVDRAVALGADRIFVMHVGRVDRPLEPPRRPWEVALVAFEVARRHRFVGDLAALRSDVEVHVMPTGQAEPPKYNDLSALRYRGGLDLSASIDRAHAASVAYLEAHGL
jgi:NTE family protein